MFTHPPSSQAVVIDSADPATPARGWGNTTAECLLPTSLLLSGARDFKRSSSP